MKHKYIILLVILISLVFTVLEVTFLINPVETEEEAIEIAVAYVFEKYGDRFEKSDKYEINVELENDTWIVFYTLKGEEYKLITGGGGPCVKINRHTGIVFYCMLQQ